MRAARFASASSRRAHPRARRAHARLPVQALDDEHAALAVVARVEAADEAVALEDRQHVVAVAALRRRARRPRSGSRSRTGARGDRGRAAADRRREQASSCARGAGARRSALLPVRQRERRARLRAVVSAPSRDAARLDRPTPQRDTRRAASRDGIACPELRELARGRDAEPLERRAAGPLDVLVGLRCRRGVGLGQHALDQVVDLVEAVAAGDREAPGPPQELERRLLGRPVPPARRRAGRRALEVARAQRTLAPSGGARAR